MERQKKAEEEFKKQEVIRLEKETALAKAQKLEYARTKWDEYQKMGMGKKSKEELKAEKEAKRRKESVEDLDTKLETYASAMTPLGKDRFMNSYWWTPARPDRLYVEHTYKLTPEMMPMVARVVQQNTGV